MSTDLLPVRREDLADLAARLRRAAAAADRAVTTGIQLDGWSGPAATAATETRQRLRTHAALTHQSCAEAADAIDRLARVVDDLGPAVARVIATRKEAALAHAEWEAQVYAYTSTFPDPGPAMIRATGESARDIDDMYAAASRRAVDTLDRLRMQVTDRPLRARDHLEQGVEAFWRKGFVDPATLAWGLTGQAITDRAGTAANWRSLYDGARNAAANPHGHRDPNRQGHRRLGRVQPRRSQARASARCCRWPRSPAGSRTSLPSGSSRTMSPTPMRQDPWCRAGRRCSRALTSTDTSTTTSAMRFAGISTSASPTCATVPATARWRTAAHGDANPTSSLPGTAKQSPSGRLPRSSVPIARRSRHWRSHPGQPLTLEQRFDSSLGHYLEAADPDGQPQLGRRAVVTLNIKKGQLFIETAYVDP